MDRFGPGAADEDVRKILVRAVAESTDWEVRSTTLKALAALASPEDHDLFVKRIHPIAEELEHYRKELGRLYRMDIERVELKDIDYAVIKSNRNVQGVLCARHMQGRPILILNRFNGNVIGSMRVPDDREFDAGRFLNQFNGMIPTFLGGGHEKAGGFTFEQKHFKTFIDRLEKVG